ncbi:hypothetical protein GDO81_013537 [Engystomops pustulosus]|uniref:Uncharacterized protein n=1 Tax=Engystomops pustulosus TaxID=76066 RepID=A0AAV7B084_ENGPU|nr:hypothetical protein GDO81_013537 [Engystomops pustulosus]
MEMPLEPALSWLRRELSEMRIQDQRLLAQLRNLHAMIREYRLESTYWFSERHIQKFHGVRGRSTSDDLSLSVHMKNGSPSALPMVLRRNSVP